MNFSYRAVLRAAFAYDRRVRKVPGSRHRRSFLRLASLLVWPAAFAFTASNFLFALFIGESVPLTLWYLLLVLAYAGILRHEYSTAATELAVPTDGLPR